MLRVLSIAIFFVVSLVNCGKGVLLKGEGEEAPEVNSSAGECKSGDNKAATDGCNTCSCLGGSWSCTEMFCESKKEKPEGRVCVEELPSELEARIKAAYTENQEARDGAVGAERTRLVMTPLLPSQLLGISEDGSNNLFKPDTDPFPGSVVSVGTPHDIRTEGYELNHGKMGMTRVYETAPGSKTYFIVDRVGGDGMGGNGKAVVEESFAYGLSLTSSEPLQGQSWHSWHVSRDNKLARATQNPIDALQSESRICGCGPLGYEDDALEGVAGDMARPVYHIAVFMLPSDVLPEVLAENTFKAAFVRKYFKKIYVPRLNKICRKYDVVC